MYGDFEKMNLATSSASLFAVALMFLGVYLITGKPGEDEEEDDDVGEEALVYSPDVHSPLLTPTPVENGNSSRRSSYHHRGSYTKALFLSPYLGELYGSGCAYYLGTRGIDG
jgi:hypothetical protein